jgi:hypothetical protein
MKNKRAREEQSMKDLMDIFKKKTQIESWIRQSRR